MSAVAFQSALASVVLGESPERLPKCVSTRMRARERKRLDALEETPGLQATRVLIRSFRVAKLLSLLPYTARVLGPRRLVREARSYWKANPPTSFYYLDEALEFAAHLEHRIASGLRAPYLREVLAFEVARLELERVRLPGELAPEQVVRFEHDASLLLDLLARGELPKHVPRKRCWVIGNRTEDGAAQWRLAHARGR